MDSLFDDDIPSHSISFESSDDDTVTSQPAETRPLFPVPLGGQKDAFRLIRLDGINSDGYMNLSLRLASISESTFTALSYVWGQDVPSYPIRVNGHVFWIRSNLWQFFITCYDLILGQDLWVDALCIDQSDPTDKERQISLMGQIYSQADLVRVWLHCPFVETFSAYHEGSNIADRFLSEAFETYKVQRRKSQPLVALTELTTDASFVVGTLKRFFSHEYWSRLWVVQELLLPTVLLIHYGDTIFSPWQLVALVTEISQNLLIQGELDVTLSKPVEEIVGPLLRGDLLVDLGSRPCVFESVMLYDDRKCSTVQDRAYGLLAISRDGTRIVPDYALSRVGLLTQLLRYSERVPGQDDMVRLARILDVNLTDLVLPIHNWTPPGPTPRSGTMSVSYLGDPKIPETKQLEVCCSPDSQAYMMDGRVAAMVGWPHLDLLGGVFPASASFSFFIIPSKVKNLCAESVIHWTDVLSVVSYCTSDMVYDMEFEIEGDFDQVRVRATEKSAYALLTVGLHPDDLLEFDFLYGTHPCVPEIRVDPTGRPLDPAAENGDVPDALVIVRGDQRDNLLVRVDGLKLANWDNVQKLFMSEQFQSEYLVYH